MNRVRTKICGITRERDIVAACEAGADAIGLVFYDPSPRSVSVRQAAALARAAFPFTTVTGLFVNPSRDEVQGVLDHVPLDLLQFHGDEAPEFCSDFGRRWMKAIRVRDENSVSEGFRVFREASGLLVDAYNPSKYGGTGETFDWSLIPAERPLPVILAGGLTPGNVSEAIQQVGPWGVDVSGGVESEKGIKDPAKIHDFINEVNRVG